MGRGVRSVQRYEGELKLPIRRPVGKDGSAVFAFSDELDDWLQRAEVKSRPYIRPILIVIDPPDEQHISHRKLALELEKFNVLTAFSARECWLPRNKSVWMALCWTAILESPGHISCAIC